MIISRHKSVLLEEVIKYISPMPSSIYVDATIGGGGHAERILEESSPDGRLIGVDIDPYMLEIAGRRLKRFGKRCILAQSNFIDIKHILSKLKIVKIDGIVFDLGVSTEHFMLAERGFSIQREGPLDMRLGSDTKLTAEDIVNDWQARELEKILYEYGQEYKAKRIVRYILNERRRQKISTTTQLAGIVARAFHKHMRFHPATKTFQALRIAVNNELSNIEKVLPQAIGLLNPGARLCVISFHSLEDRIVKHTFRSFAEVMHGIKILTKKPIVSSDEEVNGNPRARSAKLRAVERI